MQDLIAFLVGLLFIEPIEAQLSEKLEAARAPRAIVAQVEACAKAATPVVVDRFTADPFWAARTVASVWIGTASAETVLVEAVPSCKAAVDAARPFLEEREA